MSVDGIETRLLPGPQNISERTGKMNDRTEAVENGRKIKNRVWSIKSSEGDIWRTISAKLVQEGHTGWKNKITITANSKSTLKSQRHIQNPLVFPQPKEIWWPLFSWYSLSFLSYPSILARPQTLLVIWPRRIEYDRYAYWLCVWCYKTMNVS